MVLIDRRLGLARGERLRLMRKAAKHFNLGQFLVLFLLIFLPIAVLLQLIVGWHIQSAGQPTSADLFLRAIVAVALLGSGLFIFASTTIAPAVWKSLREKGHNVCMHCGHVIEAAKENGKALDVRELRSKPRLGLK
ncbi:MAG: hypothetical protein ACOY3P_15710 [Planctomycetota bacterium]